MIGFAVRAGYLEFDRALTRSLAKFVACGALLGAALWLTAKLSVAYLSALSAFRDEAALLLLIAVGTLVYAGSVLCCSAGAG